MLSVIIAGRNDDYGKDFRARLFRAALHNCRLMRAAGIDFEYILAEWNPLQDRPALSEEFVDRVPNARAVLIPPEVHERYTLNPEMPFHEMPAKNAALRRALGDVVIVTNADIMFTEELVSRIAAGGWSKKALYRAHRIDVKPGLDWDEIQDPANQLPSGEGRFNPPYYLGAGGDFCLAARSVWHTLGGFNERIRFSTRAKDWQFFLSAAAQDMRIEFIGAVYHLDHEGGFRNTPAEERNSAAAHFGKWWDIEFGLPFSNPPWWGFSDLRERQFKNRRITALEHDDYFIGEEEEHCDRGLMEWITRHRDHADDSAAFLLHAICAAHREKRRLIFHLTDPRTAVSLAGFEAIAARFGVEIYCNWKWPRIPGFTLRSFESKPRTLRKTDWIVDETETGLTIHKADILPHAIPVASPEFNPVLARRLLFAFLRMQDAEISQMAIYGAGSHTRELLKWGIPDNIEYTGTVETDDAASWRRFTAIDNEACILLSSASFESDMLQSCRDRNIRNVLALYADWPHDAWQVGVTV